MKGNEFVGDPLKQLRRKMEPGCRRRNRSMPGSKNGLIPYQIQRLHRTLDIRGKRQLSDLLKIERPIESDAALAVFMNLDNLGRKAVSYELSPGGKPFPGPNQTAPGDRIQQPKQQDFISIRLDRSRRWAGYMAIKRSGSE